MKLQIIENKIYEIRGVQVMLDFDLAEMYGIETRTLKQSIKRNIERFPEDFMFSLTKKEWRELITICDKLPDGIKFSPVPPFAFTQEGVAMLSGVLRSPIAIQVNINIMRAFVVVRNYLSQHGKSEKSIDERIKRLEEANEELLKDINDLSEDTRNALDDVFDAFAKLSNEINLTKAKPNRKSIGYINHEENKQN